MVAIDALSAPITIIALLFLCSMMGVLSLLFLIKVSDEVLYALKAQVARALAHRKNRTVMIQLSHIDDGSKEV